MNIRYFALSTLLAVIGSTCLAEKLMFNNKFISVQIRGKVTTAENKDVATDFTLKDMTSEGTKGTTSWLISTQASMPMPCSPDGRCPKSFDRVDVYLTCNKEGKLQTNIDDSEKSALWSQQMAGKEKTFHNQEVPACTVVME
jgi:hypothetical protein